jgi:hypothetical protein
MATDIVMIRSKSTIARVRFIMNLSSLDLYWGRRPIEMSSGTTKLPYDNRSVLSLFHPDYLGLAEQIKNPTVTRV